METPFKLWTDVGEAILSPLESAGFVSSLRDQTNHSAPCLTDGLTCDVQRSWSYLVCRTGSAKSASVDTVTPGPYDAGMSGNVPVPCAAASWA